MARPPPNWAFIKTTATFRIIDMPSGGQFPHTPSGERHGAVQRHRPLRRPGGHHAEPGAYSATQAGIYFVYSDDINSGKWQAVICDGTNATTADTGVTAQITSFSKFKITVDKRTSGGNGIRFCASTEFWSPPSPRQSPLSATSRPRPGFTLPERSIFKRAGTNVLSTGVDYIRKTIHYRA